ncbi:MAG: hypothetical protein ACOYEV_00175 [Candidatus Nanopelagicales bacterium]
MGTRPGGFRSDRNGGRGVADPCALHSAAVGAPRPVFREGSSIYLSCGPPDPTSFLAITDEGIDYAAANSGAQSWRWRNLTGIAYMAHGTRAASGPAGIRHLLEASTLVFGLLEAILLDGLGGALLWLDLESTVSFTPYEKGISEVWAQARRMPIAWPARLNRLEHEWFAVVCDYCLHTAAEVDIDHIHHSLRAAASVEMLSAIPASEADPEPPCDTPASPGR